MSIIYFILYFTLNLINARMGESQRTSPTSKPIAVTGKPISPTGKTIAPTGKPVAPTGKPVIVVSDRKSVV